MPLSRPGFNYYVLILPLSRPGSDYQALSCPVIINNQFLLRILPPSACNMNQKGANLKDASKTVLRQCKYCGKHQKPRGLISHERSCKKTHSGKDADISRAYVFRKLGEKVEETLKSQKSTRSHPSMMELQAFIPDEFSDMHPFLSPDDNRDHLENGLGGDYATLDELLDGDVRTVYHPKSGKATTIQHFEDFMASRTKEDTSPRPPNEKPWLPFQTRLDFEIAALALECSMNRRQTNTLIELFQCAQQGKDRCTVQGYDELQKTWDLAAEKTTQFVTETIEVPYRDKTETFEVSYRPMWNWIEELVNDRRVVSKMEWHARRLYQYDKGTNVWNHFIDEPWTANRWWNIQDHLPNDGVPLCIIFYADKSKLSSFGTAKGYPVIARLANLPIEIRNGAGLGGGRVVGWHPIVREESDRSGKTDFVDFKCIVWHESTTKILLSIIELAKTGYRAICGDDILRRMYPLVFLKSADYEEQCVMCLIRGFGGLCPCPRCLIPKDELGAGTMGVLRTAQHALEILSQAEAATTKAEKEEVIKPFGMRPVFNVFFKLPLSDPYSAVSFDNLHFKFGGVWGDHIFPLLKTHIKNLPDGRAQSMKVDRCFQKFPRWSNIFLFAAYDALKIATDIAGYQLLQVLRSYLVVDMYSELHHQTAETIVAGRSSVRKMFDKIKIYDSLGSEIEKNWDFPKLHYYTHLFDDIEDKGILKGMSTMQNEKMHGPIRRIYLNRTNFKDIGDQITRIEHQSIVSGLIQGHLDLLDSIGRSDLEEDEDDVEDEDATCNNHFALGSGLKDITISELESQSILFARFHIRLSQFISELLPASGIVLPDQRYFTFTSHDKITPYQYLKVCYESLDTWNIETDLLRCNPSFRGEPRHDFVIFNSVDGPIFAELHYLFTCMVGEKTYPLAFVQPYKSISNRQRLQSDKDLGILRLQKESKTEFISVRSIIRGAVVIKDANEGLVWDVLDGDMFLRVVRDFPGYTSD
ncbi:hypothetical protein D9757_007079 [Collybiopsis confluens]|uniref:Uncharacterized protein n=1 Tax=Collybiopsis confluens TaxID=2823264 RepID=A0A8H5HCC6_9AGAR|nr:hypothetical protein D9757_007079 [Collybiopsis confluens]